MFLIISQLIRAFASLSCTFRPIAFWIPNPLEAIFRWSWRVSGLVARIATTSAMSAPAPEAGRVRSRVDAHSI